MRFIHSGRRSAADSINAVPTGKSPVGTRFIASVRILSRNTLLILFLLLLSILAAGCMDSPRTKADDWAKRFPEEIAGEDDPETTLWEFDEREELSAETQSRYGQVVLFYEGDDDTIAQIDIKSFATENAADMALLEAMRDWELRGVRFEREDASRAVHCQEASLPGSAMSFCQMEDTLIAVYIVAEDPAAEIPTGSLQAIRETIGAISENR